MFERSSCTKKVKRLSGTSLVYLIVGLLVLAIVMFLFAFQRITMAEDPVWPAPSGRTIVYLTRTQIF